MKVFQSKHNVIGGSDFGEIHQRALDIYKQLKKKTKRRPYVRSAYFNKDKIFLDYFWHHQWQKNWRDRTRRLKYYLCALDLIENSRIAPISKDNPNNSSEILHRFAGRSKGKQSFYVQIKENKKNDEKYFMSVFPP